LARFANGPKIVFYKRYRDEADLYTMNANGTGVKRTCLWAEAHEHGVAPFGGGLSARGGSPGRPGSCPYSPNLVEEGEFSEVHIPDPA
jgi:hypothetical protein